MNKFIFITGASSGLGKELAKIYASKNCNLILVGTNEERLNQTKQECLEINSNIDIVNKICDLTDNEQYKQLYSDIKEMNIFVETVINNAGYGNVCDFKDMDIDYQIKMNHVNCDAVLYFSRVFLDDMIKNNEGHIINISSMASFYPGPFMSTYHCTKAYVTSLSQAIAYELKNTNIKVTTVCPGPFESNFVNKAKSFYRFSKRKPISAYKVALLTYKSSMKGKGLVIVGSKNKFELFLTRFLSKKTITKMCSKTIKKQ